MRSPLNPLTWSGEIWLKVAFDTLPFVMLLLVCVAITQVTPR